MRALTSIGVVTTLCWLATSASAQYRDTTGDLINPEKAINESRSNTDIQLGVEQGISQDAYRAPASVPETQGNHWRYRFQNSQWWYYQTNNKWIVWNGKSWVQPSAAVPTSNNSNQPQPHQSGYRGTQGIARQPVPQAGQPKPQSPAAKTPSPSGPIPQTKQPTAITPTQPATK